MGKIQRDSVALLWQPYKIANNVLNLNLNIRIYFFLNARAGGICESCNLIGSGSGRDFSILPAEP